MNMRHPLVQRTRLVLIGNGMAGVRALEELLQLAPERYEITVLGAEPHPNYNRILLSPVLAGEQTFQDIILNDWDWYREHGITLHAGCTATVIDRTARVVRGCLADGRLIDIPYDRLILATGSTPIMLPVPGRDLPGVLAYRDIADTQAMIEAAQRYRQAVVIGGGLLGLEAAYGLARRGMEVTVVHVAPWLMERQLDPPAADLLQRCLQARGLRFEIQAQTEALLPGQDGRVAAVQLRDGRTLPAQLVVMAVGIRPRTALAEQAGLRCERGIVVTDTMQTVTDPSIYAVGECVSHRGISYGLVAPLFEQAKVLARHLAGEDHAQYHGSWVATKLKVTGIEVFSAGRFMGADSGRPEDADCESIVMSDPQAGLYKKLVLERGRLVGACLVGDTADSAWYLQLMRSEQPVESMRHRLLFGQRYATSSAPSAQTAQAMPDDAEVCGCNGVRKGTIGQAIRRHGLTTLEEVRKHTKASASCGSCTAVVEQILQAEAGERYRATAQEKPVCGCTALTHAALRQAIRTPLADGRRLLRVGDVFAHLGWKTPNGCATCRPAVNYYLISTWPGEAQDDPLSRLVNERNHANIQKDGTYSVVPRMWGGETTAAQLRRIADVADKYRIPTIKITGGQRIDLLGVKKEDLPRVWADLGMPSGHAYAKALRTVKTCVGSEWCRFGTQDSTQMGKDLEQALWRMYAPHKVKLAVSGCPRNCAEAGIKDVGVIGVESGWEIYVAGNGGIKTEVAQFLVKVTRAEEVLEHVGAFLELYRQEGWYLERTCHFVARVGLDYVKQRVVQDHAGRRALWQRLREAIRNEPDPWHEPQRARVDVRQFSPLAAPADGPAPAWAAKTAGATA
ncbi:MAG: nitrite reductase large subunit NirB [Tepidimonas sp.]|nr:nitrite reductase large subunit NirB [Tepidimonas sp.]